MSETHCPTTDWGSLYHEFAPRGMRYASAMLRSHADAEETVQEAFCRLWSAASWRRSLPTCPQFGPVFFKTVRNLAIDRIRRRNRVKVMSGQVDHVSDPRSMEDDTLAEIRTSVQQLVGQLPPEWKDALLLRIDGGLTYHQIADVLGATHPQIRTWIYRARQQLAADLHRLGLMPEIGASHESLS